MNPGFHLNVVGVLESTPLPPLLSYPFADTLCAVCNGEESVQLVTSCAAGSVAGASPVLLVSSIYMVGC